MTISSRRSLLAAAGLAALSLSISAAFAQTVTTYGLKLPQDVLGFAYSGAWQISHNGKKALVAGYDGGAKGEAVVMIYDKGSMPGTDKDALAKGRSEFVTALDILGNAAMNPKLLKETVAEIPGMTGPVATAHITTEYAVEVTDIHVLATAIGGRLVGVRVKALQRPADRSGCENLRRSDEQNPAEYVVVRQRTAMIGEVSITTLTKG